MNIHKKESSSHLILVANPNPNSLTVQAATHTLNVLSKKHIIATYIHLDAIAYNPVLSYEEISRRASFDDTTNTLQGLISKVTTLGLFFPDWWGFPPAILVGCLQRIFIPGVAFVHEGEDFMPKKLIPFLSGLRVVLSVSSDEQDIVRVEHTCQLMCHRLFMPSGITHITYSILPNTRNTTTHQKNLWFQNNAKLLLQ